MAKASGRGRLELTWTDKDRRLLAHGASSYQVVDATDWRVAEVRLLHTTDTVGDATADNLLIQGDSLHALTALTSLPQYAERYRGQVKLCYIDPPFNTGETFEHYDDGLEHSIWLTMLRDRLIQIKQLLRPDGSVWVHLDDVEQHRGRCVLDEVFGPAAFVATVVWQKRTSRDNRAGFSSSQDYIHVYSPAGTNWKHVRNRLPDTGAYSNPDDDPRGPWRSVPMSAQAGHATASQFYTVTSPTGVPHDPPEGRAWTYTRPRFDKLVEAGLVYWPRGGDGKPRLKKFPQPDDGLVPFTLWPADEVGENATANAEMRALFPERAPFSTPKPERLLERIVRIGSNAGDLVLDCFAGSGTTAAVAHKMGRRWVTVELLAGTVDDYTRPRLELVVKDADSGGVTESAGWEGGGGFTVAEVGPSMFEVYGDGDDNTVVVAEWATAGALAEAIAAQVGYAFAPDGPLPAARVAPTSRCSTGC